MDRKFLTKKDLIKPDSTSKIYVEDYVVEASGLSFSDELGVLLELTFSQMPEKYRKPILLSNLDHRFRESVNLVKDALDGQVLKGGNDYNLKVALDSKWVKEHLGEKGSLEDLLLRIVEYKNGGVIGGDPEELSEAFLLALSMGPTYIPFVYPNNMELKGSNVRHINTGGKQIELCRDQFKTDLVGSSEFDGVLAKLGFGQATIDKTESVLLTVHSAYMSE